MRDDFLTRDWADSHDRVPASINALIHAIAHGLRRLNARQFDAPWKHEPRSHA